MTPNKILVRFWAPLALTLALSICSASAAERADDATGSTATGRTRHVLPIIDGAPDTDNTSVVAVLADTGMAELCSGTLLAPHLVLTARHCISALDDTGVDCDSSRFAAPIQAFDVAVAASARLFGGVIHPVSEIHVPRDSDLVCGSDIALIVLERGVPETNGALSEPRSRAPLDGEALQVVGFGEAPGLAAEGTRRSRSGLSVTCVGADCGADSAVAPGEFLVRESACRGDSGGPAFDQDGRIVGVAARGPSDCSQTIYTDVSAWEPWIADVAAGVMEPGHSTSSGLCGLAIAAQRPPASRWPGLCWSAILLSLVVARSRSARRWSSPSSRRRRAGVSRYPWCVGLATNTVGRNPKMAQRLPALVFARGIAWRTAQRIRLRRVHANLAPGH